MVWALSHTGHEDRLHRTGSQWKWAWCTCPALRSQLCSPGGETWAPQGSWKTAPPRSLYPPHPSWWGEFQVVLGVLPSLVPCSVPQPTSDTAVFSHFQAPPSPPLLGLPSVRPGGPIGMLGASKGIHQLSWVGGRQVLISLGSPAHSSSNAPHVFSLSHSVHAMAPAWNPLYLTSHLTPFHTSRPAKVSLP